MDPYTADWINRYLGAQFELGPYKPALPIAAEFLWRMNLNCFVQSRPDLFEHITSVYGPNVARLMRYLEDAQDAYIYQSMFNHVLSTINFSRDGDMYMLQRIDDDSKRVFPLLGELYTTISRISI